MATQQLAIFDLDGTFFRWQLYHEAVFEFRARGVFSDAQAEELDAALLEWQARRMSWHEYEMKVIHTFEPAIADISPEEFENVAETIIGRSGHKVYNYTRQLHQALKEQGYYTLAVSGSQQELVEVFASGYGFDETIGALYERHDGRYTGEVARRVPGRKHEIIREFLDAHPEITLEESVAIGDSSGDISMLEMVARPIAFNPDTSLLETAQERGWEIVIERKNIAYTLKKEIDGLFVLAETERF